MFLWPQVFLELRSKWLQTTGTNLVIRKVCVVRTGTAEQPDQPTKWQKHNGALWLILNPSAPRVNYLRQSVAHLLPSSLHITCLPWPQGPTFWWWDFYHRKSVDFITSNQGTVTYLTLEKQQTWTLNTEHNLFYCLFIRKLKFLNCCWSINTENVQIMCTI